MVVHSHSFPKEVRLRKRKEFLLVARKGRRYRGICQAQWVCTSFPFVRLGLIVRARWGDAVARNTFKRRIREAFRQSSLRHRVGCDIAVSPGKDLSVSFQECCAFFQALEAYLFGER